MQVICINSSNRPARIPENKWIKKGELYTVLYTVNMSIQVNKIGYKLEEIDLDESCFPYQYFDSNRFAVINTNQIKEVEEEKLFQI